MSESDLLRLLNGGKFDALDLGSGIGGSANFVKKRFGLKNVIGVEMDATKVQQARAAGHQVLQADATSIGVRKGVVSASFMFHFLEHLRSTVDARKILQQACLAARDFVLICQPFFGADEELLERGLKLAWSTWRAHSNKMTTLDFHSILSELGEKGLLRDFSIYYAIPIESTQDTQILPLTAGSEELYYDEGRHGPKPRLPLRNVYREVCVVARIGERIPLEQIEQAARVSRRIFPLA